MKLKIKSILSILGIIIFFIFFSYLVQTNMDFFQKLIGNNLLGKLIYLFLTIIAIVIAPISVLPLMPVASNLWGITLAVGLSVIGWTTGSIIAFILARKYGVDLIKRFVSLKEIFRFENKIPENHLFLSIIFLRMVLPPDILSYALGLFSKMKLRDYIIATIIGLIPFAFVWAYLGVIPFQYQIIALILAVLILIIGILLKKKVKLVSPK